MVYEVTSINIKNVDGINPNYYIIFGAIPWERIFLLMDFIREYYLIIKYMTILTLMV